MLMNLLTKIAIFLVIYSTSIVAILAQSYLVTGTVVDEFGVPIIGALLLIARIRGTLLKGSK